jgi:hypothetical protein
LRRAKKKYVALIMFNMKAIRVIKSRGVMGGTCCWYGRRRNGHRDFVGKTNGKRSLGRPRLSGNIIIKYIYRIQDAG